MLRHGAFLLVLAVATPAFADLEPPDAQGEHWRRELNGHIYFPSLAVADPFIMTFFELNLGVGFAWIDGPGFDLRGNMVGRDSYIAAAMAGTVAFQGSITRWLALRLAGGGGLAGGYNAPSALVVGMLQPLLVNAGLTTSWQLGRYVRLGGTFDFTYSYSKLIQPLIAIRDSLTANQVDDGEVSQRIHGYSVLPGATVAYAPHPMFGLLGTLQYLWNGFDNGVMSVGRNYLILGASGQVDFRPRFHHAPVGLLLSYRAQIALQSGPRSTHTLETGVFYTGRRAIDLGLDAQVRWFDLRADTNTPFDTTELIFVVLLRYHWN